MVTQEFYDDVKDTVKVHMDQTRKFPVKSSKGNNYITVI